MHRRLLSTSATLLAGAALTLPLTGCADGGADSAGNPTASSSTDQVVDVRMEDIRYSQTQLAIAAGTTVEFRFTNVGAVAHDAFVGDLAAQQEHESEMAAMAEMGDMSHGDAHHGDGDALLVQPGDSGTLTHTFDQIGTYEVACHQPGHYAAGMKIVVTVG